MCVGFSSVTACGTKHSLYIRIIVLDEGSIARDLKVTDHTLTELEEYFK